MPPIKTQSTAPGPGATDPALTAVPIVMPWDKKVALWTPADELPSPDYEVEFALEGLIPAGRVGSLVAAGGTGKTTVETAMFVCGAIDRPFLNLKVQHGSYVLLSLDDTQQDLDCALARVVASMGLNKEERDEVRHRVQLISLHGASGNPAFANVVRGTPIATDFGHRLAKSLSRIRDLRILGLDTLRQFCGGETNSEQIVKLAVSGAEVVARELGCAVVLNHHTGKGNYREAVTDMYAGSGSAALADNCRFVLLLQKTDWGTIESKIERTSQERGSPMVLQSTRGSLLVKAALPTYLYRDEFFIGAIQGNPTAATGPVSAEERDKHILAAVRDGAGNKTAVDKMVTGRRQDIFTAVDTLIRFNQLRLNGKRLELTEAGLKRLEAATTAKA